MFTDVLNPATIAPAFPLFQNLSLNLSRPALAKPMPINLTKQEIRELVREAMG